MIYKIRNFYYLFIVCLFAKFGYYFKQRNLIQIVNVVQELPRGMLLFIVSDVFISF